MESTLENTRPVAADLISSEAEPRLIGGRHLKTGRIVFPCPSGPEGVDYEPFPLARQGTLWSWTVQRFRPGSPPYAGPATFEPYAVGYVELAGQTIVESRLVDVAFDALAIGQRMQLAVLPFKRDADGTTVTTFAFRPVQEAGK